jgi:hypothetical protein
VDFNGDFKMKAIYVIRDWGDIAFLIIGSESRSAKCDGSAKLVPTDVFFTK